MKNLFAWGCSDKGQLGIESSETKEFCIPQKINKISSSEIVKVSCGYNHTLYLLKNGKVYACGDNEYRKLGNAENKSGLGQVQMLDSHKIIDLSAGQEHSAAITEDGKLFMWGRNEFYELGRDALTDNSIRLVSALSYVHIVQVSCGSDHTLALSRTSNVYSWGANDRGQLGLGRKSVQAVFTPQKVESLFLLPVKQICASDKFSLILTPSGSLYSCGANDYGQLGRQSDHAEEAVPLQVKHLRKQPIAYVSTGQSHVAALLMDGGVFTWGFGRYGQLGLNNYENRGTPCKVIDLMGSPVVQVECGTNHTLALVAVSGVVYAFGQNDKGQLGILEPSVEQTHTSTPVKGPWFSLNRNVSDRINRQTSLGDTSSHVVLKLFAGGNQTMMLAQDQGGVGAKRPRLECLTDRVDATSQSAPDTRSPEPTNLRVWDVSQPTNIAVVNCDESGTVLSSLMLKIDQNAKFLFSSLPCLASSFLQKVQKPSHVNIEFHGLDMDLANEVLTKYISSKSVLEKTEIARSIKDKIIYYLSSNVNYPNLECLRFFLLIPISSIFDCEISSGILLGPFTNAFCSIPGTPMKVVASWIGNSKPRYFKKFCMIGMNTLNSKLNSFKGKAGTQKISDLSNLKPVLEYLKIIHKINEDHHRIIHYDSFYTTNISMCDLETAYEFWLTNSMNNKNFSIFNYPFLFDGITKASMLRIEARCMMRDVPRFFSMFGIQFDFAGTPPTSSYHITVRRDNLLADTISQLQRASQAHLKKPFRVNFFGEDALDEGGVMKELFLLVVPEILNPDYGLFDMDPESGLCWFNKMVFDDNYPVFNGIGRLFGLAIYNNVMINLHFPLAMFKKLLGEKLTLDDLIELRPTVGKSLQNLLDYDLPDFEDVFMLNFVVSIELYGLTQEIELVPNGKNKSVSKDNRYEFVDLYVDYMLNQNVEKPFLHFLEGFTYTMQGQCIKFFKPIELQELMVGSENFDWQQLRASCQYLGEYWDKHPVVQWFWEAFFSLLLVEKKQFLRFLTGCDRVPIHGMSEIKIKIQPVNISDEHLPAAHTCYNLLDLPKYSSAKIVQAKLRKAIEHNEGFALV